jgi:hypothetical protein
MRFCVILDIVATISPTQPSFLPSFLNIYNKVSTLYRLTHKHTDSYIRTYSLHTHTHTQDISTGSVFGVIHLINKGYSDDAFDEADELYASIFASQVRDMICHVNQ